MSDYIKREDVYDQLDRWARDLNNPQVYQRDDARCVIDGIPSADVTPVRHGHWIKHEGFKKGVKDSIECSACGVWIDDMPRKTFCPNCGSIMYRYGESDD